MFSRYNVKEKIQEKASVIHLKLDSLIASNK